MIPETLQQQLAHYGLTVTGVLEAQLPFRW